MKWHAVALASFLGGAISSQTPPPAPVGSGKPPVEKRAETDSKVARRAEEMRTNLGKGQQVKSHVKVRVRLKNGNRLTGVVKDGRLVERVDGLRFVDANARDAGAGIRLWYSGGTRNYVFVPFRSLRSYEVVQRLSQKQLFDIERELMMRERRSSGGAKNVEAAKEGDAAQPAGPPSLDGFGAPPAGAPGTTQPGTSQPATTPPATGNSTVVVNTGGAVKAGAAAKAAKTNTETGTAGDDVKKVSVDKQLAWSELLRKYPPSQGWNEAKKNEIARRFQVIGARPSKHEQEFVDNFAEWKRACEHNGIDPAGKPQVSEREQRRAERNRTRGGR